MFNEHVSAHLRVKDKRNSVHGYRGVHAFQRTVAICQAEKDSVKTKYKNVLCLSVHVHTRYAAPHRMWEKVRTWPSG